MRIDFVKYCDKDKTIKNCLKVEEVVRHLHSAIKANVHIQFNFGGVAEISKNAADSLTKAYDEVVSVVDRKPRIEFLNLSQEVYKSLQLAFAHVRRQFLYTVI